MKKIHYILIACLALLIADQAIGGFDDVVYSLGGSATADIDMGTSYCMTANSGDEAICPATNSWEIKTDSTARLTIGDSNIDSSVDIRLPINVKLILDDDHDSYIKAGSDDTIYIYTNGFPRLQLFSSSSSFSGIVRITNLQSASSGSDIQISGQGDGVISLSDGMKRNVTNVSTATHSTTYSDNIIHVSYSGAVKTITLSTTDCTDERILTIKDAAGDSGSYDLRIWPENAAYTIDGATEQVISTNYQSLSLYCYSNKWYIY
jgi:hypothetical protein